MKCWSKAGILCIKFSISPTKDAKRCIKLYSLFLQSLIVLKSQDIPDLRKQLLSCL